MSARMTDAMTALRKSLAAALNVAYEEPLTSVRALTFDEGTALKNSIAAALNVTDEGSLACVNALVPSEGTCRSSRCHRR